MFLQYGGTAWLRFLVAPHPGTGTPVAPDWSRVTPVPPGTPLPVTLVLNGASAAAGCDATQLVLRLPLAAGARQQVGGPSLFDWHRRSRCGFAGVSPGFLFSFRHHATQQELPFEPDQVHLANGTCAVVYSTYRTPTLVGVIASNGTLNPAASGVDLPALNATRPSFTTGGGGGAASSNANSSSTATAAWTLYVYGSWLADQPLDAVRVTVGGRPCVYLPSAASAIANDSNTVTGSGSDGADGSSANTTETSSSAPSVTAATLVPLDPPAVAAASGNGGTMLTRLACLAPPLPWGTWPVAATVDGLGAVRPPPSSSSAVAAVSYGLRVTEVLSPVTGARAYCQVGPCMGHVHGVRCMWCVLACLQGHADQLNT